MSLVRERIVGSRWGEGRDTPRPPAAGVLMTATLRPPAAAVARSDPAERLGDYLEALRFYLDCPGDAIDRIVFADNSASDLEPLVELASTHPHGKTVEFISFDGNDHPPERGKAYGEFKLIDRALSAATLFHDGDLVWKTTGRLKFLNLAATARVLERRAFDLAVDLHAMPFVGSREFAARRHMDLRVYAFRPRAYDQTLRGLWRRHEAGFDATHVYRAVIAARDRFEVLPRLPLQPKLQGISGRHQRDYQSPGQRARDGVRAVGRRLVPWLWI